MSAKKFEIQELEERIAPSSLSLGSILGGAASAGNGAPSNTVGSVGDAGSGHIASGNAISPVVDAAHNNSLDALHGNSLNASGANISNNSPTISVSPSVAANVDVDANGTNLGGGL